MIEAYYQAELITRLKKRFAEQIEEVIPMDGNYLQGFPDLLILLKNGMWLTLEAKRTKDSPHRPNQDWYVKRHNDLTFSSFIFPENEEDVLNELERALQTERLSRTIQPIKIPLD